MQPDRECRQGSPVDTDRRKCGARCAVQYWADQLFWYTYLGVAKIVEKS